MFKHWLRPFKKGRDFATGDRNETHLTLLFPDNSKNPVLSLTPICADVSTEFLIESEWQIDQMIEKLQNFRKIFIERQTFHYVYRITEGSKYYIGVRSCRSKLPENDRYMGSGSWPLRMMRRNHATKTILSRHLSRLEADAEEDRQLRFHIGKPGCMNIKRPRK